MEDRERALWSAVVLQALEDVRMCGMDSPEYGQAAEFLTGRGSADRAAVADLLGLHPDDLRRAGLRAVRERRLAEGLSAEASVPAPQPRPPAPEVKRKVRPLPALRAPPAPRQGPLVTLQTIRDRPMSPFSPFYRRPSRGSAAA